MLMNSSQVVTHELETWLLVLFIAQICIPYDTCLKSSVEVGSV